eukprot:scaffold39019_cov30-Tisochrysis_lutea.AAC.1
MDSGMECALYDVVVSEDREAMGTSSQPFLAPSGADKEQLLKFRITQPTLYDTTSLSWPQVPDAMFDDVKEQQPSQINSFEPSLVTYDVPEGQYCSLRAIPSSYVCSDLAQPNGLTFCAPELALPLHSTLIAHLGAAHYKPIRREKMGFPLAPTKKLSLSYKDAFSV